MRKFFKSASARVHGLVAPVARTALHKLVSFKNIKRLKSDALRRKTNSALLERVEQVSAALKADRTNEELKLELKESLAAVFQVSDYIKVASDAPRSEIEQLIRAEKVYPMIERGAPISDALIQEFRDNRLGGKGMNRNIMRLQIDHEGGTKSMGHLCRWHSDVLEGDTNKAMSQPAQAMPKEHLTTIFWSICSYYSGAGPEIIKRESVPSNSMVFKSTASPSRQPNPNIQGFTEIYARDEILKLSDEEIRSRVMAHQLTKPDDVRDFHLGEGASIGHIQINRDAPQGSREWITINYFYESEHVTQNRHNFHSDNRKYPVAEDSFVYVPDDLKDNVYMVSKGLKIMPKLAA